MSVLAVATRVLLCDMSDGCGRSVAMIDEKGFVYCADHGVARRGHCRCRKMTPAEIKKLERGETIAYSRPKVKATESPGPIPSPVLVPAPIERERPIALTTGAKATTTSAYSWPPTPRREAVDVALEDARDFVRDRYSESDACHLIEALVRVIGDPSDSKDDSLRGALDELGTELKEANEKIEELGDHAEDVKRLERELENAQEDVKRLELDLKQANEEIATHNAKPDAGDFA